MSDLRRQQRIAYHTRVRLRPSGADESFVGRVINLSRSGLFVTGAELPPAGHNVDCKLVLAGERCTLRGRVAWVRQEVDAHPAQGPAGAGIEFVDLSQQDTDLLSRIIEPKNEERLPVDVWFEGMAAPVRSQAVIANDGLRLATKLPFLRLNSQVKVSFSLRGVDEVRIGTLDSVTLQPSDDDGIPHLQLGVSTHPAGVSTPLPVLSPDPGVDPSGTFDLPPLPLGPTAAERAEAASLAPTPLPLLTADGTPVGLVPAPEPRRMPLTAPVPLARAADESTTRFDAPPPLSPAALPVPARNKPRARGALWLVLALCTIGGGVAATQFAPRAKNRAPTQPVAALVPVPSPPPVAPPLPEPPVVAAPANPVAPPQPDLPRLVAVSKGDTARLSVPVSGSFKGAQRLPPSPGSLTVSLPRARPRIPSGTYTPDEGPFRQIVVQRKGAGTHIRFEFDAAAQRPDVRFARDAVQLVLRRRS